MTEAIWLTVSAAAAATAVLSVSSVLLSDRSARRIDRLRAERAAADDRLRDSDAEAERALRANLINTQS